MLLSVIKCRNSLNVLPVMVVEQRLSSERRVPFSVTASSPSDYFEPQDVCLAGFNDRDYITGFRVVCSIHLYSPRDIWIRRVGMDWPRYFFGTKRCLTIRGGGDQPGMILAPAFVFGKPLVGLLDRTDCYTLDGR